MNLNVWLIEKVGETFKKIKNQSFMSISETFVKTRYQGDTKKVGISENTPFLEVFDAKRPRLTPAHNLTQFARPPKPGLGSGNETRLNVAASTKWEKLARKMNANERATVH